MYAAPTKTANPFAGMTNKVARAVGAGLRARPLLAYDPETQDRHGGLSLRRTISKVGEGFFNNPLKGRMKKPGQEESVLKKAW